MKSDRSISDIVESIYDCAGECSPQSWLRLLRDIAAFLASGPAAFTLYSPSSDHFDVIATTYSGSGLSAYNEQFRPGSKIHIQLAGMRPGKRFHRSSDLPDAAFIESEMYRGFFKKEGVYDLVYAPLFIRNGLSVGVSFSRPTAAASFGPDDLRVMDELFPHLRRALQVYMTVREARRENRRMTETLSKFPRSVMFLDRSARVVYSNEAGQRKVARKDGIEVDRNGVMFASVSKDERHFKSVLSTVFEPQPEGGTRGGVLPISRPSGLRPLQLLISPFTDPDGGAYAADTLALVFVFDPERPVETDRAVLCQMYGLTPAEAGLAGLIAKGRSLAEAAVELGITEGTVRTHLKRVFAKTGTNRQSDLTTLILNSPAALKNL